MAPIGSLTSAWWFLFPPFIETQDVMYLHAKGEIHAGVMLMPLLTSTFLVMVIHVHVACTAVP